MMLYSVTPEMSVRVHIYPVGSGFVLGNRVPSHSIRKCKSKREIGFRVSHSAAQVVPS